GVRWGRPGGRGGGGAGGGTPADAGWEGLEAVRHAVCVSPRWRRAAALDAPAPPRHPRPNGRPRTTGKRLPPREQVLTDSTTPWTTVTGANGYGARDRHVQSTSEAAVGEDAGEPVAPSRLGVRRAHE